MKTASTKRRGVALLVVLVLLAAVVAVTGALTWNTVAARKFLGQREHQLQAEWLARGGVERARAQAARGEEVTKGEWRPLGERGLVAIEVKTEDGRVSVRSEATFPADEPRPATREASGVIAKQ
jgi:type II secretory pathway component PulK